MLEITVAQFEAIPREWRMTRVGSRLCPVGPWVPVKLTDATDGRPFSGITKQAVSLYVPAQEKKKMPINMTVKEWKSVPEYWRSSRMRSELHADPNHSQVFLTDDSDGLPHGSVHLEYWRSKSKPVHEITIAVWADGTHAPVIGTPEEHLAKLIDECHGNPAVTPVKYVRWKLEGSMWCCYGSRRVEMRPVVLP